MLAPVARLVQRVLTVFKMEMRKALTVEEPEIVLRAQHVMMVFKMVTKKISTVGDPVPVVDVNIYIYFSV